MNSKSFLSTVVLVILMGSANAQIAKITFLQGASTVVQEAGDRYVQLTIKPEPFTIIFPGKELHACTGLTEDLFNYTKPETDINADYNSYFFIFKFAAMPGDAQYLPIEKDMAASLNETHGAKPLDKKRSQFTVSSLMVDGEARNLSDYRELYLALWLDENKDQYIDKDELLKLKVSIE